jgi:hypothetical protein
MLCAFGPNASIKGFLIGFRKLGSQFINCHLFLFTAQSVEKHPKAASPEEHQKLKGCASAKNKVISLGVASSKIAEKAVFRSLAPILQPREEGGGWPGGRPGAIVGFIGCLRGA